LHGERIAGPPERIAAAWCVAVARGRIRRFVAAEAKPCLLERVSVLELMRAFFEDENRENGVDMIESCPA